MIDNFRGDFAFLSNFYDVLEKHGEPIVFLYQPTPEAGVQTVEFKTSEHNFHWLKTEDPEWRDVIQRAPTPKAAKSLGRQCPPIPGLFDGWNKRREIMFRANMAKFSLPFMWDRLLATGTEYLVEGNYWHDNDWGNCTCGRPSCSDKGKNYLGLCLMAVREKLALASREALKKVN